MSLRRTMPVLILGTLMSSVDATATNVALHTLGRELRSPVGDAQWVITAYLLAVAAIIPASGWLARRFGSRQVYTAAMGVFVLASALCATSGSLATLVAFRVLQGLAGGLMAPTAQLIAAEIGGPQRAGRTLSRVWTATSLGSIIGPSLGGLIIGAASWRWIFLINVPLGVLAMTAAVILMPDTPPRPAGRLDWAVLLRVSLGMPVLVFALAQAGSGGGFGTPATLVPLGAGAALMLDFVRHALRAEQPLLDVRLYLRRPFALGTISLCSYTVVSFGLSLLLPLYFQQARHLTPALAGVLVAPQAIGSAIGMTIVGRVREAHRVAAAAALGLPVIIATTTALAHLSPEAPYWAICSLLFATGVCGGVAWIASVSTSYGALRPSEISHAAPFVSAVSRVGGAIGTALAAIMLQHQLTLDRAARDPTGVTAAFHWSFQFEAVLVLIACAMYFALSRRVSRERHQRAGASAHG